MTDPVTTTPPGEFETPDPIFSTEAIGAFIVAALANVYILLGADLSDDKKNAIAALITSAWLVGTYVHAAVVRKGRAIGSAQR